MMQEHPRLRMYIVVISHLIGTLIFTGCNQVTPESEAQTFSKPSSALENYLEGLGSIDSCTAKLDQDHHIQVVMTRNRAIVGYNTSEPNGSLAFALSDQNSGVEQPDCPPISVSLRNSLLKFFSESRGAESIACGGNTWYSIYIFNLMSGRWREYPQMSKDEADKGAAMFRRNGVLECQVQPSGLILPPPA
jgi:hypothetical protein